MAVSRRLIPTGLLLVVLVTACAPASGSSAQRSERSGAGALKRMTGGDWLQAPGSDQIEACIIPATTTDRPKDSGAVLLTCRINASGHLIDCATASDAPKELVQLSICASRYFVAKPEYRGMQVETMIVFRAE